MTNEKKLDQNFEQGHVLHEEIEGCVAICPLCGSDLSYQDYTCVCKNPNCHFHCDKCKSPDEP